MRLATAILLLVCISTATVTLGLTAMGAGLTSAAAWLGLGAGLTAAACYWRTAETGERVRPGAADWAAMGLFALFAARAFCWLIYDDGGSVKVLSINNIGDLPLHLTYLRYLARGAAFWPENPIYSGMPLHYPAGIDVFSAMLELAGCDERLLLAWMGLAGCGLLMYALLRWDGWFAIAGILCNGGLAGWRVFHRWAFHFQDYQAELAWKNIALSMLVTQRGLLYAIPAGVLLLAAWREQWFRDDPERPARVRLPVWAQAALYGTMPLFHLHTFLFLSGLLGFWIMLGREGTNIRREAARLILCALIPATVFVSLVTGLFQPGESAAHVIHLKPGWMQEGGFVQFWGMNFGILPLAAAGLMAWTVVRYNSSRAARDAFHFALPCIAMFGVTCVVMFAPWEWDNMKLMIWAYIGVLPCLHTMIRDVLPWRTAAPARALIYAGLFLSGFVSLIGGLNGGGYEIANATELEAVRAAVRPLPVSATFAGWPAYNHPLLMSGCKMIEGYDGHLYSHGIDYQPRLTKLTAMMMGDAGWRATATELKVRYLYWGEREQANYSGSLKPWGALPVVAQGDWGRIYDLGPAN